MTEEKKRKIINIRNGFKPVSLFMALIFLAAILAGCNLDTKKAEKHFCYYGYPEAGSPNNLEFYWENSFENLIENAWNIYQPRVIRVGGEYPYLMYLMGWAYADSNPGYPGSDAIFVARGKELNGKWEVYAGEKDGERQWDSLMSPEKWVPVICPNEEAWWDCWHNGDPSIVLKDGIFYMAYSPMGFDKDGYMQGDPLDRDAMSYNVMGATSTDGFEWTKTDDVIIKCPFDEGVDEETEKTSATFVGFYSRPSLMWDGDRWRLWFDYWDGSTVSLGYAENYGDFRKQGDWELINYRRSGQENGPLMRNITNPEVIKIGSKYYLYCDPPVNMHGITDIRIPEHPWISRQIVEFVSDDGLSFTLSGYLPPDTDAAANQVPTPFYEDGHLYLFYSTQKGDTGSGYDYRYDRARVFWRCIKAE